MKLQATLRTVVGKQVNAYRIKNQIPAVIYSKHIDKTINIFFDKNSFLKVYKEAGKSLPIEIIGDGINELVLIHEISVHPVTTMLSHVDFLGVKKGEAVHAEVELKFVGESPAEKNKLGRVEELLSSVHVYADPTKLPKNIEVDLSVLATAHDVIFIRDLKAPTGVKIDNDPAQAVVTVIDFHNNNEDDADVAPAAEVAAA
jgi:large subunit ribosomal protein L25